MVYLVNEYDYRLKCVNVRGFTRDVASKNPQVATPSVQDKF